MDHAGNIIVSNPVNILIETMVEDSTYTGNIALITGIEVLAKVRRGLSSYGSRK